MRTPRWEEIVAKFHFVEDYERHVAHLLANHPLDVAMSLAVGGSYDAIGAIEKSILVYAGLRDSMSLIDLGCGSGRLTTVLGREMKINYLGLDVVQSLLDYARSKAPKNYQFVLNRVLSLPSSDASADMICGFSIFTHLLHEETYLYLEECRRVLRIDGRVVFSFLEFAHEGHWHVFEMTFNSHRIGARGHLNTFIERGVIELWASKLGFVCERFVRSDEAPWVGDPLGQSLAILRKV
jgi:SAM-dependent methyltransferase